MPRTVLIIPLLAAFFLSAQASGWPVLSGAARAQGMEIRLGDSLQLAGQQLEVTADLLEVDQESGVTVFSGNVLAVQDALRLRAGRIQLHYSTGSNGSGTRIERLEASGGVTLVTDHEAVEAQRAVYVLDSQTLEMHGEVVFVQGVNVLSGDRFFADLRAGTGRMQGRVRTVITLD